MTFRPVSKTSSYGQNLAEVNDMVRRLNKEQITKTFKQSGGNSIVIGRLPYDGGYGLLIYDTDNVPRILIGTAPDDGRVGTWVSDEGQNVLTLLGG